MRENKNPNNKENHGVVNSASKKEIIIVGDSMIKHVNGREVSRDNSVKIRCHPGATTDDIIDYVRPTVRKKPDMIIIHTGTNDIQNKINTKKLERLLLPLKKLMLTMKSKLLFQVPFRKKFEEEIKEINKKWENLCTGKGISLLIILILMVHALVEANYT